MRSRNNRTVTSAEATVPKTIIEQHGLYHSYASEASTKLGQIGDLLFDIVTNDLPETERLSGLFLLEQSLYAFYGGRKS